MLLLLGVDNFRFKPLADQMGDVCSLDGCGCLDLSQHLLWFGRSGFGGVWA